MNTLKFLKLFVTSSHFRVDLRRTLAYAMASHEPQRGDGAADVMMFKMHFGEQVFDEDFASYVSVMRENIERMEEEKLKEKRVEWTIALQKYWREKGVDIPK